MSLANTVYPEFRSGGLKWLASEVLATEDSFANVWYVDGDNGSDSNVGNTPTSAFAKIQTAVTAASAGDTIYIKTRKVVALATDPTNYTENIIIPNSKPGMKLIGVSSNETQGGLPQIKVGTTTTSPIITLQAPGTLIANLGINGAGATGGGILLDSDGGTTKDSFGTTIVGCHFKNCVGTTATNALTGGAIMWSANGGSWQVRIVNNIFFKNVGDIVLKGTSSSVPQDVVIQGNTFQGIASAVDVHIITGGSGILGLTIDSNTFADVKPALGSATTGLYVKLTGSTGVFSNNVFSCTDTTTGFGAAAATAVIPTTVGIAHNYSDGGLIVRQ
jgi:hypothetical protein